jgi:peptide/nickel transport system substrate-binding protein
MDREARRKFEAYRRSTGPIENTVIDDLNHGELDRAGFIRRGAMFGLSASVLSTALVAAGEAPVAFAHGTAKAPPKAKPVKGGRLRVAFTPPTQPVDDPFKIVTGASTVAGVVGEYLMRVQTDLTLAPQLGVAWKPNADASAWTVNLRPGVKFQNGLNNPGKNLAPEDVVATWKRLADPSSGSQAISSTRGVLTSDGIVPGPRGDQVTFNLQTPTASFPYIMGSNTYQAIILPSTYQLGSFVKHPQTTGAFQLTDYVPGPGGHATYDRNPNWWGGTVWLDGVDATLYSDPAATNLALLGGNLDLLAGINRTVNAGVFNNPQFTIQQAKSGGHQEFAIRVDNGKPWNDPRVRRALALSIDRPGMIKTLWGGYADLGNDSPFAPVYPSTTPPPAVPQRVKNVKMAKQLLAAAGYANGLPSTYDWTVAQELNSPDFAQIVQQQAKEVGINLNLKTESTSIYYGGSQTGPPNGWGNTPWLNDPLTITGWGARAVPNVFLTSALQTGGVWNESHYSNPKFDAAVKSYLAAVALSDQRKYSKVLETILLNDTPTIYANFFNVIAAQTKKVNNYTLSTGATWYSNVWLSP